MKLNFSTFLMIVCLVVAGCSDEGLLTSAKAMLPAEPPQPWLLHSPPDLFYDDPKVIALCEAVRRQRVQDVERLLEQGVDINAVGKHDVRPVAWCLPVTGDCFELLLRSGADLDFLLEGHFPGGPIIGGRTPLSIAARYSDADSFALTLDHTDDPNLCSDGSDPRPLNWAIAEASEDSAVKVRLLICKGATVNIPDEDPPILIRAITAGKFDAALVLMEHGADVSVKDLTGADVATLAHAAMENDNCTNLDKIRLNAILDRLKPVPPVDPNNKYPTPDDVQ